MCALTSSHVTHTAAAMATTATTAAAAMAEERKLRAGWEALDEQNPKAALKVAAAVLKKRPASQPARALKAVALMRLASTAGDAAARSEAEAIADELLKEAPTDEGVIYALVQVEKHAGHPERTTPLYQALWDRDPGNESAAQKVFLSYVRESNYDQQQRVVTQMLARFPASPQLPWWRCASLYCRAAATPLDPAKRTQLLTLCEALVRRAAIDEGRVKTAPQAEFVARVLADLGRWELLATLLLPDGPLGRCWICAEEREAARADALLRSEQWPAARDAFAALLRLPATLMNWDHLVGYVEATAQLARKAADDDARSKLLAEAKAFLEELCSVATTNNVNRGPFLALAELEKRTATGSDTLLAALTEFVARFSTKPSCALDVRPYVEELVLRRGVARGDLAKRLEAAALSHRAQQHSESAIHSRIFVQELQRMLGLHASPADMLNAANTALELFDSSTPGEHGAPSAGDEAVLLCYAALLDHARSTQSVVPLYDAAAALEAALARNENACQARLCLIDCYLRLGALRPAAQNMWSKVLGIKNILVESVSHILVGEGERHGDLQGFASSLLDAILALHHENEALVPENALQAYTAGTYAKVAEFFRFRSRMQRSLLLAYARTESLLVRLPGIAPTPAAATARLAAIKLVDLPPMPSPTDGGDALECTADLDATLFTQWDAIPAPAKQIPPFLVIDRIRLRRCALRILAAAARSDVQSLPAECAALLSAMAAAGIATVAAADVTTGNLEAAAWTLFAQAVQMAVAGVALFANEHQPPAAAMLATFTDRFAVFNTLLIAVSKALRSYVDDASRTKFAERLTGIAACITQGLYWCSIINYALLNASEAALRKQKQQKHKASQQQQQQAPSQPSATQAVRERCRSVTAALSSLAQAASDVLASIAALPPYNGVPAEPLAKLPASVVSRRDAVVRDVAASQDSTLAHFQRILSAFKLV